jgi:hypothetical protein
MRMDAVLRISRADGDRRLDAGGDVIAVLQLPAETVSHLAAS